MAFGQPTRGRDRTWQFHQSGHELEHSPPAHLRVNETDGLLAAVRLGLGIAQLPDMLVQDEVARGERVELLAGCGPEPFPMPIPMPINIVHPSGRLLPARVRVAIEALGVLRLRVGLT